MIAICERTSIEITLENATNYAVYALLRLFSIIETCERRPLTLSDLWPMFIIETFSSLKDLFYCLNFGPDLSAYPSSLLSAFAIHFRENDSKQLNFHANFQYSSWP